MDAQAKKKLFRERLNAQKKKDNRIDNPLVKYNESDQPVCVVCNLVLKSESNWDAHRVSRKHHEAYNNAMGRLRANNLNSESPLGTSTKEVQQAKHDTSKKLSKSQTSSVLTPNFSGDHEIVNQKPIFVRSIDPERGVSAEFKKVQPSKQTAVLETKQAKGALPEGFFDKKEEELIPPSVKPAKELKQSSVQTAGSENKQVVKGALPEGFFDNKDADLLARGIKPVKPDIKDEYKEFEKLIQEDLQVVDSRMEEEEIDAAEMIEEEEQLEQRSYKEKVETLKKKKMELDAARSAKRRKDAEVSVEKPRSKESSSDDNDDDDDDDDENFAIDWRAQHL